MRWLVLVGLVVVCSASCSSKDAPSGEPLMTEPTVNDGMRITYAVTPASVERARAVVRARIADAKLRASTRVDGATLIVDLAARDMDEANIARELFARVGKLELKSLDDPQVLSNDAVSTARLQAEPASGEPVVVVELTDAGRAAFAALTRRITGKKLLIAVDDQVLSAPIVQEEIPGGRVWITLPDEGSARLVAAEQLVTVLRSGALPEPLREESVSLLRDGKVAQPN